MQAVNGVCAFRDLTIEEAGINYRIACDALGYKTVSTNAFTVCSGTFARLSIVDDVGEEYTPIVGTEVLCAHPA